MIRRPPRSTLSSSSAASDVYKRQMQIPRTGTGLMSLVSDSTDVVVFTQVFPALERDRQVAISPEEIVKCPQAELVALRQLGIGKKMQDLTFPNLIADGLPRSRGKERGLGLRRFLVHGHMLGEVVGGLGNRK